ncbi:dTMP kinase [Methanosphaera sp. WGK6]|uniref:dTMP kinase n=1 Tax=Methanosphaera sp. WGK6 TaxID=1561964 RepID=UPI00084C5E61|nr:dTMP kinase [Methanosphaera sp. WGK6]OED30091.1 thymidylate kinase [Methanosphaera sp. WGK6]
MYIVLEGIDGAGKSTQTQLLKEWLTTKNYETKIIVEPTNSEIGQLIRKQLLKEESTNDINQQMLALLFAADRLTLKQEILDAKNSDKIILSDRSFYSSICYQNNESIDISWVANINIHTPQPDLTIILDLNEQDAIKRCDKEEVFETITFLEKTRKNYLKLLKTEKNIIKIDATPSTEEVQEEIREKIATILKI